MPRALALAGALLAGGCYDYLAVTPGPQPADLPARVTLTPAGTTRVTEAFGPYIVGLEATLQGPWPADSLRVRVFATRHQTGFRTDVAGVPMVLARAEVDGVQHRKLNKLRTGVLAGLLGVGIISFPSIIQNAGGGGGTGGPSGPPQP